MNRAKHRKRVFGPYRWIVRYTGPERAGMLDRVGHSPPRNISALCRLLRRLLRPGIDTVAILCREGWRGERIQFIERAVDEWHTVDYGGDQPILVRVPRAEWYTSSPVSPVFRTVFKRINVKLKE